MGASWRWEWVRGDRAAVIAVQLRTIRIVFGVLVFCSLLIFFFQAEDGIRDLYVTGVQTCALPIYRGEARPRRPALRLDPAQAGRGGSPARPHARPRRRGAGEGAEALLPAARAGRDRKSVV